jgi:hypothetical protein
VTHTRIHYTFSHLLFLAFSPPPVNRPLSPARSVESYVSKIQRRRSRVTLVLREHGTRVPPCLNFRLVAQSFPHAIRREHDQNRPTNRRYRADCSTNILFFWIPKFKRPHQTTQMTRQRAGVGHTENQKLVGRVLYLLSYGGRQVSEESAGQGVFVGG